MTPLMGRRESLTSQRLVHAQKSPRTPWVGKTQNKTIYRLFPDQVLYIRDTFEECENIHRGSKIVPLNERVSQLPGTHPNRFAPSALAKPID